MTILTIPDTHFGLLMFSLRQINIPLLSVYVFTSPKANISKIKDIPLGASILHTVYQFYRRECLLCVHLCHYIALF